MRGPSWNTAEVRFLDYDRVLDGLRAAVRQAQCAHPEIHCVYLFGSLAAGNWTADSDADLIVVVRQEFADILSRSVYQIHTRTIPTDSLIYSESEFRDMQRDPRSFISRALPHAINLSDT